MRFGSLIRPLLIACGAVGLVQFASAQETPRYFFEGDMVRGVLPGMAAPGCVLTSQFKRGEAVVWRVRVLDSKTGRAVDDKGLKSLTVVLPGGEKFASHFSPHPRGRTDDYFWAISWKVPDSYPTGTISYKVIATDLDGHSTTWEPFKVTLSQLTIVP